MADAEDLKSSGDFSSCGFDSHPGHQFFFTFNQLHLTTLETITRFNNSGVARHEPDIEATAYAAVAALALGSS